ncbi:MAG: hypothetical protein RLZZ303_3449 [Candidatus Hydrogenedentota bacterium]|jgi:hypothetical protein
MRALVFVISLSLLAIAEAQELRWEERLPSGVFVEGLCQTGPDGLPVVHYFKDGMLLSEADARALGIVEKTWNVIANVPAAMPSQPDKSLPTSPVPRLSKGAKLNRLDATPDRAALAKYREDAVADAEKGLLRTGMFSSLETPFVLDDSAAQPRSWQRVDGGRVFGVEIVSAGAVGIRVEFSAMVLPPGASVVLYDVGGNTVFGPYDAMPSDTATLWSPTVPGDSVVVEVFVPEGGATKDLILQVQRVVHQYYDPADLMKANAGNCNLDVTCYPAWAATALGVGGLGVIGSTGSLFCTGTLLNDEDPCTDEPYLLTARHCVGGQTAASTLEFYWEYQTPSCNGTPPSPSVVPRTTGGADYLAGMGGTGQSGGGNDFSLLLMRNDPPANLTRVGFSSAVQSLGTDVTCVHHPRGDYKRISFGDLTSTSNPHQAFYHEVIWNDGTTEPGSSGSPMLLTATQQIIGQLWGGGASCSNLSAPDYYGRFDITYPIIAGTIGPNTVAFDAATFEATEDSGIALLELRLTKPAPAGGIAVQCTVTSGTAMPGNDYEHSSPVAQFNQGDTLAVVSVPLVNDSQTEPDQTFTVTLENPGGCAQLASINTTAVVTIIDDDVDGDGDGISDTDELAGTYGHVTEPLLWDSDGDGLSDREEQLGIRGGPTDPNLFDSDTDGISDGLEWTFGSDPNVPNLNYLPSLPIPLFEE